VGLSFSDSSKRVEEGEEEEELPLEGCAGEEANQGRRRRRHRYPIASGRGERMMVPRMSLLGKPIHLAGHKAHYRNTASMRWKMRLRSFLEQPQGFLAWLYHFCL